MTSSSHPAARTSLPRTDDAPPRRICVFIDGTWNDAAPNGRTQETHVHTLYRATPQGRHQGLDYHCLYVPGVGCRPDASSVDRVQQALRHLKAGASPGLAANIASRMAGGLFGRGTAVRIRAAYQFISGLYRAGSDDQVYLFGFSRGAFAVRSLAGFIGSVGLLLAKVVDPARVEQAYALYESAQEPQQSKLRAFLRRLTGHQGVTEEGVFHLPIHFLGVWDAVASLGLPGRLAWFTAPYTEYHQRQVPPSVMKVRHALALHELRRDFEPHLWLPTPGVDMRHRWFAGAHGDVGGGYPRGERGLQIRALVWMVEEARQAGLDLPRPEAGSLLDESPVLHHEVRGVFAGCTPTPRSWLNEAPGVHPDWQTHEIDDEALRRLQAMPPVDYRFWRPGVNRALHQIDERLLCRAVALALLQSERVPGTGASYDDGLAETYPLPGLTVDEFRSAPVVLADAVERPERLTDGRLAIAARALVLSFLLFDRAALSGVLERIDRASPDRRRHLLELAQRSEHLLGTLTPKENSVWMAHARYLSRFAPKSGKVRVIKI